MTRSLERLVLDALPVTVYAVDLDGRITFAGNHAPGSAKGVVGRAIADVLADDASRGRLAPAMDALRAGRASTVSWEIGETEDARTVVAHASAMRDGRAVSGFVFALAAGVRARDALVGAHDALARAISVERVLQELTHQLRHSLQCDGVAIALAGRPGDAARLVHQSGLDDQEQLETQLADGWRDAIARGRPVARRTARGVELTAPLAGGEGALGAITVTIEHADEREAADAEQLLVAIAGVATASLERASMVRHAEQRRRLEAIGEVAAGVAHELRNPLFGISSAAQLLRFRVKEDPVVEKNVGRILREVERLNGMMTSLLEYGRPAPQKLRVGDPDAVWDGVIEAQRGLLEARALRVTRTRPKHHAHCRIDPEQLGQAFLNVFVNAVDAAPEGTDLALVSESLPGGGWRCRLQNGGPPIPADTLPRVFELFFSTKPGSAGIGLPLSQRIVEGHGGDIAIESGSEQGTAVSITLPAAPAEGGVLPGAQRELELGARGH
jgi:signal transduction histidine kinase